MALRRLVRPLVGGSPRRRLVLLATVALALRLVALDARVAHFDEARVAVVILRYHRTGEWLYFPALHGPFLFHVGRALFALAGPGDAVLRLPVALVGGLLPLGAWLYRDHLDDAEVVALGAVLAVEPFLVYYSRFARNDLLVAAFMVLALGFWLRLCATGRARYLYAGTATLALGIASKENAALYLLCWIGAGTALLAADPSLRARLAASARPAGRRLRRWLLPAALAAAELLVLVVLLFAPRGGDRPRLGRLATSDGLAVVEAATVGSARRLVAVWVLGGGQPVRTYAAYLGLLVGFLLLVSLPLLAFAAVGWAVDRRRTGRPRPLLRFGLLWAGLSVAGYPYATDVMAGWTVVHVVVPLAVPAAVGVAAVGSAARAAPRVRRRAALWLAVALVLAGATVGWSSYAAPGAPYNPVGQPGQGSGDLRATVETVGAVADRHRGTDVGYYGPFYADGRTWRLPFEWYLVRRGADVGTLSSPTDDPPPVVIALDVNAGALRDVLDGYACVEHDPYPWGAHKPGGRLTETLVYVDRAFLPGGGSRWKPADECGRGPPDDRPVGTLVERLGRSPPRRT